MSDVTMDMLAQIMAVWPTDRWSRPRRDRFEIDQALRQLETREEPDPPGFLMGRIRAYLASDAGRTKYRVCLRTFMQDDMYDLPDEAWQDDKKAVPVTSGDKILQNLLRSGEGWMRNDHMGVRAG